MQAQTKAVWAERRRQFLGKFDAQMTLLFRDIDFYLEHRS